MAKRRPLPYAAAGLLDEAVMALSMARKQIKPLIDKSDIETVSRAGRALDEINQAMRSLETVRNLEGEKS